MVDTLTASVVEEPQQRAAAANISDYIFDFLTAPAAAQNNAGGLVAMDVAANPCVLRQLTACCFCCMHTRLLRLAYWSLPYSLLAAFASHQHAAAAAAARTAG